MTLPAPAAQEAPNVPPLALEEAQERLLALAPRMGVERVDIDGAIGRYLAEPIHARRTQPAAHLSAMDGYAVIDGDATGPWQVIGESAAGHPYAGRLAAGQAVRIATGALLPADAGAVILQEDLARDGDTIRLTGTAPEPFARHVRPRGMDFGEGAAVLPAGIRIGPAQAALAISAGHRHLAVRRRPLVAILDSGDELAADPECCAEHQIPASNGTMLEALMRTLPVDTLRLGPVPDRMDALAEALEAGREADVIVTTGGASVGDHDLIRPALEAWGADLDFWRVAIKPGKPILVATREVGGRRRIVVGLPGNPVSSHVTAYLFVLPLLRAMLGAAQPRPLRIAVPLAGDMPAGGSRREFLRARWDGLMVALNPLQDSGALSALASSNFLVDRAARAEAKGRGSVVEGYSLENGGIA